jgi:hypothetical protein
MWIEVENWQTFLEWLKILDPLDISVAWLSNQDIFKGKNIYYLATSPEIASIVKLSSEIR